MREAGHSTGRKDETMKHIKSAVIITAAVAVTALVTYHATVDKMFDVANTRAHNAYSYGKQQGYQAGYDYAVKTARLTADDGQTYIITYGDDDGNKYDR